MRSLPIVHSLRSPITWEIRGENESYSAREDRVRYSLYDQEEHQDRQQGLLLISEREDS